MIPTRSGTCSWGISTCIRARRSRLAAIPTIRRLYDLPDMSKGVGAALTYNFDPHWGVEVDFGYNWGTANSETTASSARASSGGRMAPSSSSMPCSAITAWVYSGLSDGAQWDWRDSWRRHGSAAHQEYLPGACFKWTTSGRTTITPIRRLRNFLICGVLIRGRQTAHRHRLQLGGAPSLAPAAACSVQPTEVMVGEPITATVDASNFNPKHTVTYSWSGNNGGQITGKDTTASIDTNNVGSGQLYDHGARDRPES